MSLDEPPPQAPTNETSTPTPETSTPTPETSTPTPETPVALTAEEHRRADADAGRVEWRRWGPYLAERQWGTVREDYSATGDAWSYFTHDQARSRAYKWGEDGIAGFSDDKQRLCLGLALWNGNDPILKERLFGLTNAEGNHGEDVKEYYFYLDATPTHSYQRMLYKYPQGAYPYTGLTAGNSGRSRRQMEFELLDTKIFDEQRYFDVEVEYAKADDAPEDLVLRVTVHNRGPDDATLHVLPTLWFRNTWWRTPDAPRPSLTATTGGVAAVHPDLGEYLWQVEDDARLLFCDNETNTHRLPGLSPGENAAPPPSAYPKDAINDTVVSGTDVTNPAKAGTKVAAHSVLQVPAGGTRVVRARLVRTSADSTAATSPAPSEPAHPAPSEPAPATLTGPELDAIVARRRAEADEFHESITPESLDADRRSVMRQAFAGMLWSKQYYEFDVDYWLREHGSHPREGRPLTRQELARLRNARWSHLRNAHIMSMPDTWEYPWYAAWDLAFHVVALAGVDPWFAKHQVQLMLSEDYLHPSGQMPAYEWDFGDVNPPVHAWAALYVFFQSKHDDPDGAGDVEFLRDCFHKLLLTFTWWVNRKDPDDRSAFEGGFLGLDNIGVFDRSKPLPTGGRLEQADGSAWMAMFSLNLFEMAVELAAHDPSYEDYVVRFTRHFFAISEAMDRVGNDADDLWDDDDGFYFDVLRMPDGAGMRLEVHSMVGLLPLIATALVPDAIVAKRPGVIAEALRLFGESPGATDRLADPGEVGPDGTRLLSALNASKLVRVLSKMLDESAFLSPHGIRSLSRRHLDQPFRFDVHGVPFEVAYEPAESSSGMFGGNSNWRGPVWMPVNLLLLRALLQFARHLGPGFAVEYPTGSGVRLPLGDVALDLAERLVSIFLVDDAGRRPVYGGTDIFSSDPHWRDLVLFYEYFHGDNGAGLGASHQTGWTGVVARLLQLLPLMREGRIDAASAWSLAVPYRRPRA